jgi:hypothetical protein
VETHLLSPMNGRVYVNLPEGGMFWSHLKFLSQAISAILIQAWTIADTIDHPNPSTSHEHLLLRKWM